MTAAGESPVVVIRAPGRTPLRIVVVETIEVGRSCSGVLLDDPAISRRHLVLRPEGATIRVQDLDSANGTRLDGQVLHGEAELAQGQVVQIGDVTLAVEGTQTVVASAELVSPAENLTALERVADAVLRDRAVPPPTHEGQTRTIVFSDIEGSTALAVELGDVRWFDLLEVHNRVLRSVLSEHAGTEVKSQGDGFMLTFPSARRALAYMIDMQRQLAAAADIRNHELRVRVGAHTGEAVEADDGDLYGQAVIAAARIGAAASGGEILVSSLVREIVESWGEVEFGPSRVVELKGLSRQWTLHPVLWDQT